jgi:hypothetical protein
MLRGSALVVATLLVSCTGADHGKPATPDPNPVDPRPNPDDDGGALPFGRPPVGDLPNVPLTGNVVAHEPESFLPAWKKVGVGQTISFGVAAIDPDLDETAVEVATMPASATFDAITQTVTWTPTADEVKTGGSFVLTIKQADQPGGGWTKIEQVTFDIAVDPHKQPAPVAASQSAVVETLLAIRERARLTNVNLDWPLDKMLAHGADLFGATLPPEIQAKLGTNDRENLYTSFLKSLSQTHDNPRLDPDSTSFDRDAFGSPESWKIVAVRPRIDKAWNELRVVYQATAAREPVFAMFRLRPTWDVPTLPPEARAINNELFGKLVARHLLGKDLGPNAKHVKNAKAHAKAVAALVTAVVTYVPPPPKRGQPAPPPWHRAAFVALQTAARMGGGSARTADGSYRSGDGWAWSVMKPMANAGATAQAYVDVPIPGFWTAAVASPDGKSWIAKCAPKFDPEDPQHAPGYEVLCRKALGLVDLPDASGGKVAPGKRDAVNLFVEHKRTDAVAFLPLDDGRRDHGEENGMTCAQCHTRRFGVRDYADAATADPSAGPPRIPNAPIATLNFQIVPSATAPAWAAFTLEHLKDQECKGKANLEAALGKPTKLTCPLAPPAAAADPAEAAPAK